MATTGVPVDEIMQIIREHRSSESNFSVLSQQLDKAIALSEKENDHTLLTALQEVKEKYVAEYQKATETGGTAWPEFENFVTQFERSLTNAAKEKE